MSTDIHASLSAGTLVLALSSAPLFVHRDVEAGRALSPLAACCSPVLAEKEVWLSLRACAQYL
ncbi:hypothetical protein BLAT2472_80294 [Burkholderia latens]